MTSDYQALRPDNSIDTPIISIGMPVYNGSIFIREALDLLLAQTYRDFELIISDNASTDETEDICREYAMKDARIRYIRQDQNLGAVANFKFVLNQAVGKYFMWAAADDRWAPSFVEKLLQIHFKSDFTVVMSRYYNSSRKWRFLKSHRIPVIKGISSPNLRKRLTSFWSVQWGYTKANLIYGIWKRSIAKEIFDENSFTIDGWDFAFLSHALVKGAIFQADDVLFEKMHKSLPCNHVADCVLSNFKTGGCVFSRDYIKLLDTIVSIYPWLGTIIENNHLYNIKNIKRTLLSLRLGILSSKSV